MSLCGITTKGNPEQTELARLILDNNTKIIYCTGNAGTGKTFVTLASAIQLVSIDKKYGKRGSIIYLKNPVECGNSLGYLPGSVEDKYSIYLGGLYDNLQKIEDIGGVINANNELNRIECMPPQYIKSHSYDQKIIIVDEAQDLTIKQIRTILTRVGDFCKVILLGSTNQIDTRGFTKERNDFMESYNRLKDLDFVGYVHLMQSKRSKICSVVDERLAEDYYEKLAEQLQAACVESSENNEEQSIE